MKPAFLVQCVRKTGEKTPRQSEKISEPRYSTTNKLKDCLLLQQRVFWKHLHRPVSARKHPVPVLRPRILGTNIRRSRSQEDYVSKYRKNHQIAPIGCTTPEEKVAYDLHNYDFDFWS